MEEHRDAPEVLEEKVKQLAELVRTSEHFVAFTGAGISTSAGIGDFRGPDGKWTCQAQGRQVPKSVDPVKAYPTATHMSLVELQRQGILKYVISQNCDGLHRRSGLPASAISELHGNGNVEICEDCGQSYFRDFQCTRMRKIADHFTGRFCSCHGRLLNSTIDFGQTLPERPLKLAEEHSRKADLHLALGSSLTVHPACGMPAKTAKHGGNLVICNLQKTPLDQRASIRIFAETDKVMEMLMALLAIPVPSFTLVRRVVIGQSESEVHCRAVDPHNAAQEIGLLRAVDWDGTGITQAALGKSQSVVAEQLVHSRQKTGLDLAHLKPVLYFVGHYGEPPLQLDLSLAHEVNATLSFDPYNQVWTYKLEEREPASEPLHLDKLYGEHHFEYCLKMRVQKGNMKETEAKQSLEEDFENSRWTAHAASKALGGSGDPRMAGQ